MPKNNADNALEVFTKIINYQQFERSRSDRHIDRSTLPKKFDLAFTTDGKKCSLHYRRVKDHSTVLNDGLRFQGWFGSWFRLYVWICSSVSIRENKPKRS